MKTAICKGLTTEYNGIENRVFNRETPSVFALYFAGEDKEAELNVGRFTRVSIAAIRGEKTMQEQGSGYFVRTTARIKLAYANLTDLQQQAVNLLTCNDFDGSEYGFSWNVKDGVFQWEKPKEDTISGQRQQTGWRVYQIAVEDLATAIQNLKQYSDDISLQAEIDIHRPSFARSNTKRLKENNPFAKMG